jgi:hypothetical protein
VDRSLVEVAMGYRVASLALRSIDWATLFARPMLVFWDYFRGAHRRTAKAIGSPTKNM